MLYLGIDQHAKQLTISLRNEDGEPILRRQVSTQPTKIDAFFQRLHELTDGCGFMALLEVCGFNDWLIERLNREGCQEVVLIHPDKRSRQKTDRRDAHKLSETLWLNRHRLANHQKPQGIRRVCIPCEQDTQDRTLTTLRKRITQQKVRTINRIKRILRRYNLMWDCPTKTFQTKACKAWLKTVKLPELDRFEMDLLLKQWELVEEQLQATNNHIEQRYQRSETAQRLATIPGISVYSSLAIACRISNIERFDRPRSLANYFGLTPSCRNSGNVTDRLGSITKQGSAIVRWLLAEAVISLLRRDQPMRRWYQQIKTRRGSRIARVAAMRRLCTIIWHMEKHQEAYYVGGPPRLQKLRKATLASRLVAPSAAATGQAAIAAKEEQAVTVHAGTEPSQNTDNSVSLIPVTQEPSMN